MEGVKELLQMEEKLLNILRNVNSALEANIDVIVDRKTYILQDGARQFTGKNCYIYKRKVKYEEKKYGNKFQEDDIYFQFQDLMEMKEEFDALGELSKEFEKISLACSDIVGLLDHETMFTKLIHFYVPGQVNFDYIKIQSFCKSNMKEWFRKYFIEPTMYNDKKKYYTEEQGNKEILQASGIFDFKLLKAFELEVYLKQYERMMIKRLKKSIIIPDLILNSGIAYLNAGNDFKRAKQLKIIQRI